jgi:hypothetical protein
MNEFLPSRFTVKFAGWALTQNGGECPDCEINVQCPGSAVRGSVSGALQFQRHVGKTAATDPYAPYAFVIGDWKVGDAAGVNLELLKRGVIVRPVAGDGLPEWLRVSIGLPHENQTFLDALTAIVQADAK